MNPTTSDTLRFRQSSTWIKQDGLKVQNQDVGEHSNWVIRDKDLAHFALSQPPKVTAHIIPEGADWLLQVIADSRKQSKYV